VTEVGFFGDSYTAGYGDPTGLGWVGRVAAAVPGLTAYNGGVPGDTSPDVAGRWLGEARGRPGLVAVVLAVGTNDLLQGIPLPHTLAVLDAMLAGSPWPVLVVGPPPVAEIGLTGPLTEMSTAMAGLAVALAVPYVDVIGALGDDPVWLREQDAGDGFHPSAAGYERLARVVTPPVRDWLAGIG
jgi:lysophospholipase L1-like esterase